MTADPEISLGQPMRPLATEMRRQGRLTMTKQSEAWKDVDSEQVLQKPLFNWPMVELGTKQYIPEDWVAKETSRRLWISGHGDYLVELDRDGKVGDAVWCCKYCSQPFKAASTISAATHLSMKHNRHDSAKEPPAKRHKSSVLECNKPQQPPRF
ncbi:hypothetical protein N657DRAFT_642620 [Parathielavia appendiculata]|uniref:Uncharacterized protein n=1 Tax=Parathielavia appendiculata TaxID=2587402 RepID=A0AAN6U4L8_9PEZI|nr:hypothetical protein N657DRAFT_642620 [Parathielavia appendiculata]